MTYTVTVTHNVKYTQQGMSGHKMSVWPQIHNKVKTK